MTDLHPLVRAVLDVTPRDACGEVVHGVEHDIEDGFDWAPTIYGAPEPIAARQAAEMLRVIAAGIADDQPWAVALTSGLPSSYDQLADVIEGAHRAV